MVNLYTSQNILVPVYLYSSPTNITKEEPSKYTLKYYNSLLTERLGSVYKQHKTTRSITTI